MLLEREIDPSYLGRIAAKTAEQAIKQRLRQFEKEHIQVMNSVIRLEVWVTGSCVEKSCDLIIEVGKAGGTFHGVKEAW